jgi:hypothetical protein
MYLREPAVELRLAINVPNYAHSQFIARGAADPVDETLVSNESVVQMAIRSISSRVMASDVRS